MRSLTKNGCPEMDDNDFILYIERHRLTVNGRLVLGKLQAARLIAIAKRRLDSGPALGSRHHEPRTTTALPAAPDQSPSR